jgi:hypothetical protein
MRIQLTKITLAVGFVLAITFTLSACSSDDDGGGNAPSGGITNGSGSFSGPGTGEKAQVYEIVSHGHGELESQFQKYTGNGDIQIEACDEEVGNCEYIDAGKIEGGYVKLQLPNSIDAKYLKDMNEFPFISTPSYSCNIPSNVKFVMGNFRTKSMEPPPLSKDYLDFGFRGNIIEDVFYSYLTESVNLRCDYEIEGDVVSFNVNFAKGWNEAYASRSCSNNNCNWKISTDKNILQHLSDMKWTLN